MKYIASYSAGRDSTAMVLKILETANMPLDEVIYYESGVDFKCIETNANKMKELCEKRKILFTTVYPASPFLYEMLERPVLKKDENGAEYQQKGFGWCSGKCRWGTGLKIAALREAYKKYDNEAIVEYIGIAANERKRMKRVRDGNRVQLYPLIEWEMDEDACLAFCRERGWSWPAEPEKKENSADLYNADALDRVSCRICGNKNMKELYWIYCNMPDVWNELIMLQEQIPEPFKRNYTVYDLDARFKQKRETEMKQYSLI